MKIRKSNYQLELLNNGGFEIQTNDSGMMMLRSAGVPFLPVTNRAVVWGTPEVRSTKQDDMDVVTFELPTNCLYDNPQVVLECREDYVAFYFRARVKRRMALHKWHLLGKGSEINAIECLDFRSHINSPSAYETHQTILGRRKLGTIGLDANTVDDDLMFAPHPMLFVFQHLERQLLLAPMELISGESLHVKMIKGSTVIEDCHIRIGDSLFWLQEGEILESPHFMITLSSKMDVFETLTRYTDLLVRDGHTKPKKESDMEPWWLAPMWCSWGDQHTQLDSDVVIHTAYSTEDRKKAVDNITVEMVDKVVRVIEEHQLPVRTLIIDDKWYTKQGDMRVDTSKFPDLRGMVDRLHAKGFKVMAWASLYQFDKTSEVFQSHPEWFLIHHYPHNPKNPEKDIACLDYSDPDVAGLYLGELMERLLSDKEGCYNLDGIKFDWPFLLPHDYAFSDRSWVGKEKTIHSTQKLVYEAAKAAKKDALIIGVSPHPFFQDTQDMIRTYDVSTFDIRIHLDRAKYVKAIAPGMTPVMDEHVYYQNFFRYVEEGARFGPHMIFNLLRFNGDGHAYTDDDYRQLKILLDRYVEETPKLKAWLSLPQRQPERPRK